MRCTFTVDAGVYVLGALAPADRAAYERHLNTCADCREEVAELAGLPGLLGRLDPVTASSIASPANSPTAPPQMLDSVLGKVRRERTRRSRRRRWQYAGAALAAACLAVLVGFGVSIVDTRGAGSPGVVAQMRPAGSDASVSALLGYVASGNGMDIRMLCMYRPSEPHDSDIWNVTLVIYPRDGSQPMKVATWPVQSGTADKGFSKHISMKPSQIGRIELNRDDGTKLLVYQPT
jgi:anti-sigma-K factor RskA